MATKNILARAFYKGLVYSVLSPLRDQTFKSTRKAKISDTEKEALASGSVGFEGELLGGRPNWGKLLDMPPGTLTAEEQAFLDGPVETLCDMLDDWQIRSELKDLPHDVWAYMKKHGFFGMIISKEYGGLGFSARAHSEVVMKLASRSTTACVTAMVPNSLGPAELLMRYGTDDQKNYYLPRLARGEEIPSFALTEPDAGSDASGMTSVGVVCQRNGQLGILLSWSKRYITLAPVTTLLGVAFKLKDPDCLLGGKTEYGITLALVPANTPGVTTGQRHNPLSIPFQNGPTSGKDVWIPVEQIIGGKEFAGQGWRMLMECLSVGRCISLPALSVGSSKLVCRLAGAYSRIRKQFKVTIGQFEGVEELLARMAGTTYAMEAARILTLQMLDRGEHPTVLSAILKYHLTENGRKIFHYSMKGVSRAQGRSATAAIAYRTAEKVTDHRTGEVYDYTRRSGVLHTELVLPNNDTADREQFWNTVEMAEKRKDAKVARELVIGLPHELPFNEQKDLIMGYAQELSKRYGWGVDVAIHAPGKEGDHRNTHAHLLCTTRNVIRNPETGELEMDRKSRMWDVAKTSCELVRAERKRWEHLVNHSLERAGHETRVDHRSYEIQQSPLLPQVHLGVKASQLERQGIPTERGDYNREVQQHNSKIIELAQVKTAQWEVQREQYRQEERNHRIERYESMPFEQLKKTMYDLYPPSLHDMVLKVPEVKAITTEQDTINKQIAGLKKEGKDIDWSLRHQTAQWEKWREEHPRKSWLHEHGVIRSKELGKFEDNLAALTAQKEKNLEANYKMASRALDASDRLVLEKEKAMPWVEKEHESRMERYKEVREVYRQREPQERALEKEREQAREKERQAQRVQERERSRERGGGMER